MTIITYRDGVMASDSLVTCGDVRSGKIKKIINVEGHLFGMAGVPHCLRQFALAVLTGKTLENFDKDFCAMHVTPDGEVIHYHGDSNITGLTIQSPFHAIGSGAEIALGAMEMGATAEQAVRAAIKHSTTCGGKLQRQALQDE